ncbi:hypothetical protein [Parabacteroides distasonis]|uniref:hypothetical protein n=1 Tax=Parabacteroides distasonis TaxID=823 RepID=UPI0018AB04B3|nr:hypothetical protein [Parabacteroides distasonis]
MVEISKSIVFDKSDNIDDLNESSELDLNELLEVEGGLDVDECAGDCGLGCFLAGIY